MTKLDTEIFKKLIKSLRLVEEWHFVRRFQDESCWIRRGPVHVQALDAFKQEPKTLQVWIGEYEWHVPFEARGVLWELAHDTLSTAILFTDEENREPALRYMLSLL